MSAGRRRDVMALLRRSDSPLSILAIADLLHLHPNTVRFHLRHLLDGGQVQQVKPSRNSPGRPPLMFRARAGMDPAAPRNYRLLADILTADLATDPDPTAKAQRAGQAWGQRLTHATPTTTNPDPDQAVGHLIDILDDLGFAPQPQTDNGHQTIGLRQCPFLDLVNTHADVICPIHLGLMQGALSSLDTTLTVERLDPFVQPDLCLAHLGPTHPPH
jgi:predicted ArsR family transcriptional regulator